MKRTWRRTVVFLLTSLTAGWAIHAVGWAAQESTSSVSAPEWAAQSELENDRRREQEEKQKEKRAGEDAAKIQAEKDAFRAKMQALQAERQTALQSGNTARVAALNKQIRAAREREEHAVKRAQPKRRQDAREPHRDRKEQRATGGAAQSPQ